jgi:hypothetical protein
VAGGKPFFDGSKLVHECESKDCGYDYELGVGGGFFPRPSRPRGIGLRGSNEGNSAGQRWTVGFLRARRLGLRLRSKLRRIPLLLIAARMRTHQEIDARSLHMAKAIVEKIDADPTRRGLEKARATCRRWFRERPSPALGEWQQLLQRPWSEIRTILLDESETGARLRQNDPFCGILTPQERWAIYRAHHEKSRP